MNVQRDESFRLPVSQLDVDEQIAILEKEVRERKAAQSERDNWLAIDANKCKHTYTQVASFSCWERGEIDLLELELADLKRRCSNE